MTTIHPSHPHPLQLHSTQEPLSKNCFLCFRVIWNKAYYICQEGCKDAFFHRACVESPPQIDSHPLHPLHPLTLVHGNKKFICHACRDAFFSGISSFSCVECHINLDICCVLSTLSDEGCSLGGKTSEQITLPLHPHTLTSLSISHDFVLNFGCHICEERVQGDAYRCFNRFCKFRIHKRCIQDLYYADGTKAPRIYHGHPLETFVREDTGSSRCASCASHGSGEFIGCSSCQVFYHRHCFQVPDILQYPSHHPDHTLVLFPHINRRPKQCQSCSCSLKDEIYYRCTSCEFSVHVGCALQVLAYFKEGMSAKIKLSWHKHPLLLCHLTESALKKCIYCMDKSIGPSYVCQEEDCSFLLHKQCTEIESTIKHPHHPDHPLILCEKDDDDDHRIYYCEACTYGIASLKFSCQRCLVHLHIWCAARFPTLKHYLHEHKLLQCEWNRKFECNRCSKSYRCSTIFRCIPCNFNLHEECMELPLKVKSKIHWHSLTLHETFIEDDSGEYYCEECEKPRDPRLGAYVCGECKLSLPRIYHIECVLPELAKVYAKVYEERLTSELEKLNEQITDKKEKLEKITRELKETTQQLTRELDELKNQHSILLEKLPESKRSAFCLHEETPMEKVNDSD